MKRTTILILLACSTAFFLARAEFSPTNKSLTHNPINKLKMKTNSGELQSFNEYQEVLKALQPYIESARTGDGTLSRTAFYNHAHVVGAVDGELSVVDPDQFASSVAELGASENIQHHVAWIDISGPAAAAKVEFLDWQGFRFTDFFVLYKKDGEWKISGKVYDSHTRN